MTWDDVINIKIPISVFAGALAIVIAAYVWGEGLQDKQAKTQEQLDQLVKIVAEHIKESGKIMQTNSETMASIEQSFALLVQEIKLRREYEKSSSPNTK